MPTRKAETYTLGAVDSRSNPANYPPERALRCLNFSPQQSGALRLRSGYSVAMPATTDGLPVEPIHTMVYYEQFAATQLGPQYVMYGKGNFLANFNMTTKVANEVGNAVMPNMPTSNPWGHFRANNYIHLSEGSQFSAYGYEFALRNWDGTTLRPSGIPTASSAGTVAVVPSSLGSFATTQLGGYTIFLAWYDPITQHMGNRATIGTAVPVSSATALLVISGIAQPPNPEWVTAVGMTNDGGVLPYWLVDGAGNHIVVGNGSSVGTISVGNVDAESELPINNFIPPPMDKFTRVGTRAFGNLSGNPFILYSEDQSDITNANFVGDPYQSWPADNAEPFPTGELPTALHCYRKEGWFFSRNYLAIFNVLLAEQGSDPWRGPWAGGCCGQRAFVETPYGPYWLSGNKQLSTFVDDGVISVSKEYEASLLAKLANKTLRGVELAYLNDPDTLTDEIVIRGLDSNGNVVIVVHDFNLEDERSPFGCGYNFTYSGAAPRCFAGSGYTPRQNVYDTGGIMRLWSGDTGGFITQLEDGSTSDNGANFTGDHISLLNVGERKPGLDELAFQGDSQMQVSYTSDYSQSLAGFTPAPLDLIAGETSWYGAKMSGEARYVYLRLQLTSHPADGNYNMTDPPFVPMPTYGCINAATFKLGAERPEAR